MLLLLVFVASYLLFVFISESLNPFSSSAVSYREPHKKLGVAAGVASIASGLVAMGLLTYGVNQRLALIVYLSLTLVLLIPSLIRFKQGVSLS